MVPCIAVFDIGKKSKKLLLFNQRYQIIKEEKASFEPLLDDDGDNCENLPALTEWLRNTWQALEADQTYDVLAVNFVTYGASLVHLNDNGELVAPLYNYLKSFPGHLEEQFYGTYGDKLALAAQTASPALGMLNSGLQLYYLKYQKPEIFSKIKHSLHFPQYIAYLFTGQMGTEYTSIGCHTMLWDFQKQDYHDWVYAEELDKLFPPLKSHYRSSKVSFRKKKIPAGWGLHDSSSALIPYLKQFSEPFLLLSTGTWGIVMNPFSQKALSATDLQQDCLQYLTFHGSPVKASRKFIGYTHGEYVKLLAKHYNTSPDYYKKVQFDESLVQEDFYRPVTFSQKEPVAKEKLVFELDVNLDLSLYDSFEAAYHQLIALIARQQIESLYLSAEGDISKFKSLLIEGCFSRNSVFMSLMKKAFPELEIKSSNAARGTTLGAALVMNIWLISPLLKNRKRTAIEIN